MEGIAFSTHTGGEIRIRASVCGDPATIPIIMSNILFFVAFLALAVALDKLVAIPQARRLQAIRNREKRDRV
jgi:hypothetical protein